MFTPYYISFRFHYFELLHRQLFDPITVQNLNPHVKIHRKELLFLLNNNFLIMELTLNLTC